MRKFSVIIVSIMLSACASLASLPEPVQSEYFTTIGGGFVTTLTSQPTQQYGVTLVTTKDLPQNAYAVVEFPNPANKTQPFITEGSFEEIKNSTPSKYPNMLILKSPVVHGVTQHTNYLVTLSIYSNSSKKSLVARHQQIVNSEYIEN
jgi:uncharacterized protein YceK